MASNLRRLHRRALDGDIDAAQRLLAVKRLLLDKTPRGN